MKKIIFAIIIPAIVILLFWGYFGGYFNQIFQSVSSGHFIARINSFPAAGYEGQTYENLNGYLTISTVKNYQFVRESYKSFKLINLATKDVHEVSTDEFAAALGDGYAVWVVEARTPKDNYDPASLTPEERKIVKPRGEYNLWMYDFGTQKEILLLERFDNNHNSNLPSVTVNGRNVAIATFANKIIIINIDTKENESIVISNGYDILPHDSIHFIGNSIIVQAWKPARNGHTYALIEYNTATKATTKLYEPSWYGIASVRSYPDGYLYWQEFAEWAPRRFYKMKIGD